MKKYILSTIVLLAFSFNSCSNFVDGYEVSPNSPVESNPALLTTVTQVTTFAHYTGQLARLSSVLIQACDGVQFQLENIANYSILEGDNQNEWDSHYSTMLDAEQLIMQAGNENPHYRGIGRVIKAMTAGLTTDLWGDIPYSQALNGASGEEAYNPAFDSQQSVYEAIQGLLDDAIADFGVAADQNLIVPGTDDLIYGGEMGKWLAAAWALKARYAIHLTAVNGSEAASNALTYVQNAYDAGFNSPASDMEALYTGAGNTLNQWYAFNTSRADYIKIGAPLVMIMKDQNDPRLPFYAAPDANGDIVGSVPGSLNTDASNVGSYFSTADANSPILTFVELKFIEAEAAFRNSAPDRAATAYNDGIIAHVTQVTGAAPDQAFIDAVASEDMNSITLEKIMTQKYVSLFTQIESYNDWRRTGIPSLSPVAGAREPSIPVRLPTPINERIYNTNAQVTSDITVPVWWDQD